MKLPWRRAKAKASPELLFGIAGDCCAWVEEYRAETIQRFQDISLIVVPALCTGHLVAVGTRGLDANADFLTSTASVGYLMSTYDTACGRFGKIRDLPSVPAKTRHIVENLVAGLAECDTVALLGYGEALSKELWAFSKEHFPVALEHLQETHSTPEVKLALVLAAVPDDSLTTNEFFDIVHAAWRLGYAKAIMDLHRSSPKAPAERTKS